MTQFILGFIAFIFLLIGLAWIGSSFEFAFKKKRELKRSLKWHKEQQKSSLKWEKEQQSDICLPLISKCVKCGKQLYISACRNCNGTEFINNTFHGTTYCKRCEQQLADNIEGKCSCGCINRIKFFLPARA